jgi:oxygen-dependent protoporphyrinogen oxidase
LGNKEALVDYRIHRWKNALPLYDVELEKVLRDLKKLPKDLYLHGNYMGGIGLSKILDRSKELAEEIANDG